MGVRSLVGFERRLKFTVLEIDRGKVKLGFDVDPTIPVHQMDVWERINAESRPCRSTGDVATPVG